MLYIYETIKEYPPIQFSKKQKLVIRIQKRRRTSNLEHIEFRVDVRLWIDTPSFSGFSKKGFQFPLEKMEPVISQLNMAFKDAYEHLKDKNWRVKMS